MFVYKIHGNETLEGCSIENGKINYPVFCHQLVLHEENGKNYTTVTAIIFQYYVCLKFFHRDQITDKEKIANCRCSKCECKNHFFLEA